MIPTGLAHICLAYLLVVLVPMILGNLKTSRAKGLVIQDGRDDQKPRDYKSTQYGGIHPFQGERKYHNNNASQSAFSLPPKALRTRKPKRLRASLQRNHDVKKNIKLVRKVKLLHHKKYRYSLTKLHLPTKRSSLIVSLTSKDKVTLLKNVRKVLHFMSLRTNHFKFKDDALMQPSHKISVSGEKRSHKQSFGVSNRNEHSDQIGIKHKRASPSKKFAIDLGATNTVRTPDREPLADLEKLENDEIIQSPDFRALQADVLNSIKHPSKENISDKLNPVHQQQRKTTKDILQENPVSEALKADQKGSVGLIGDIPAVPSMSTNLRQDGNQYVPVLSNALTRGTTEQRQNEKGQFHAQVMSPTAEITFPQNNYVGMPTVPAITAGAEKLQNIRKSTGHEVKVFPSSVLREKPKGSIETTGSRKDVGPRKVACEKSLNDKMNTKLYQKLLEGDKSSPSWLQDVDGNWTESSKETLKNNNDLKDFRQYESSKSVEETPMETIKMYDKADKSLDKEATGFLGYQYSKLKNILSKKNASLLPRDYYDFNLSSVYSGPDEDCKEVIVDDRKGNLLSKLKASPSKSPVNPSPRPTYIPTKETKAYQSPIGDESVLDSQGLLPSNKQTGSTGASAITPPKIKEPEDDIASKAKNQSSAPISHGQNHHRIVQDAINTVGIESVLQETEQSMPDDDNFFSVSSQQESQGMQSNSENQQYPMYSKFRGSPPKFFKFNNFKPKYSQYQDGTDSRRPYMYQPDRYSQQRHDLADNQIITKGEEMIKSSHPPTTLAELAKNLSEMSLANENPALPIVPVDPGDGDATNTELLRKSRKKLSEASYRLGDKVLRRIQKSIFFSPEEQTPEDKAVRDALNATLSTQERKEFIKEFLLLRALEELYAKTDWEKLNKEAEEEAGKIEKLAESSKSGLTKSKDQTHVKPTEEEKHLKNSLRSADAPETQENTYPKRDSNSESLKYVADNVGESNDTFVGCKNVSIGGDGKVGSCKVREGTVYVSKSSTLSFETDGAKIMQNASFSSNKGELVQRLEKEDTKYLVEDHEKANNSLPQTDDPTTSKAIPKSMTSKLTHNATISSYRAGRHIMSSHSLQGIGLSKKQVSKITRYRPLLSKKLLGHSLPLRRSGARPLHLLKAKDRLGRRFHKELLRNRTSPMNVTEGTALSSNQSVPSPGSDVNSTTEVNADTGNTKLGGTGNVTTGENSDITIGDTNNATTGDTSNVNVGILNITTGEGDISSQQLQQNIGPEGSIDKGNIQDNVTQVLEQSLQVQINEPNSTAESSSILNNTEGGLQTTQETGVNDFSLVNNVQEKASENEPLFHTSVDAPSDERDSEKESNIVDNKASTQDVVQPPEPELQPQQQEQQVILQTSLNAQEGDPVKGLNVQDKENFDDKADRTSYESQVDGHEQVENIESKDTGTVPSTLNKNAEEFVQPGVNQSPTNEAVVSPSDFQQNVDQAKSDTKEEVQQEGQPYNKEGGSDAELQDNNANQGVPIKQLDSSGPEGTEETKGENGELRQAGVPKVQEAHELQPEDTNAKDTSMDSEQDATNPDANADTSQQDQTQSDGGFYEAVPLQDGHDQDSEADAAAQEQQKEDANDAVPEGTQPQQEQESEYLNKAPDENTPGKSNENTLSPNSSEKVTHQLDKETTSKDQYDPYTTFKKSLVLKGPRYVQKKRQLLLSLISKVKRTLLDMIQSKVIHRKSNLMRRSVPSGSDAKENYVDLNSFFKANKETLAELQRYLGQLKLFST